MLSEFLRKDKTIKFFKDITSGVVYQEKEIPITICNERIDPFYYPVLIGYDAIIKYAIIIEDDKFYEEYLSELQILLRKLNTHQEIKSGINELLINLCQKKLGLKNIVDPVNKEEIIKHFYNKYIVNGYYFHSFPSVFLEDVENNGLTVENYFSEADRIKDIENTIKKYYPNPVFCTELENLSPYFSMTDSPFMGAYYAYTSPQFLNDLTSIEFGPDAKCQVNSFFKKDYSRCKKNLARFMKKQEFSLADFTKVSSFLLKEWDFLKIPDSFPVFCMIKRSVFSENKLSDINSIMEESFESDISSSISKILDIKFNNKECYQNISRLSFEIEKLPSLEELGIKKDDTLENEDGIVDDEYGNVTILALIGVLFITIGMTAIIIMLGR